MRNGSHLYKIIIRPHIFLYSEGKATESAVSRHGFGFFGLGCFSGLPGVSHVRFACGFSFQLTVFPSAIWNLKISLSYVFLLCQVPYWKNLHSFREKDGASFSFTCIGGMPNNQNAVVSEDERQLYTGFNYTMNLRGKYNHYKRLLKII